MTEPIPCNIEAEQCVLACMIYNETLALAAVDKLTPQDFYRLEHQQYFKAIQALVMEGEAPDALMVSAYIRKSDEQAGKAAFTYLNNLPRQCEYNPYVSAVESYCKLLKGESQRRSILKAGNDAVEAARDRGNDNPLSTAQTLILECEGSHTSTWETAGSAAAALALASCQPRNKPIRYGIPGVDRVIGGIIPGQGDLTVIAARSSHGKTAFLNMGAMEVVFAGYTLAYFSLETTPEKLVEFMASNISRVDTWRLANGLYQGVRAEEANAAYLNALAEIGNRIGDQMKIESSSNITLSGLVAKSNMLVKQLANTTHPVGAIFVDFIQLLASSTPGKDERSKVVTIIQTLQKLSYRLKVPVVALSQITTSHKELDTPPTMYHIAEAPGAVIAAADKILLIHNPPPPDMTSKPRPVLFTIAKHKRGMTGRVRGMFYGTIQRFTEVEMEDWEDE